MKTSPLFILLLILFCSPTLSFAGVAGKVKMVLGKVMVVNDQGVRKRLRRGNKVHVGDMIFTSKRGQAQLTMIDDSKISIRPGSKFLIEEFVATGKAEDQKTYYKLLRGGFRSVTGKIGKKNKSSYRLSTPVATMGIRGTDFTGKYCADDCPASTGKNGLFVDVISGGISMENEGGKFDLDDSSNGFVASASQTPISIAELPDNLLSPKSKKRKNRKSKRGKSKKDTYPSPDEEMVQIGLYVDPNNRKEILSEAMDAGMPPAEIMRGADNAGIEAKTFMPDLIKKGKEHGLQPSDFVNSILESGIEDKAIGDMISAHPDSASDILTAAIATGEFDNETLKNTAASVGVSAQDISAADTIGNLFALPPAVKRLLNDGKKHSKDNKDEEDENRSRALNPASDSGEVASPS